MFRATAIISVLLAAELVVSAIRKLAHGRDYVATYLRLGVPEDKLNYLAIVLLLGAGGLIVGLLWAPVGIAASIGLVCYFLLAIGAHVRASDARHMGPALLIELGAVAALILRLSTM